MPQQPWVKKNRLRAALVNEDITIGHRELPDGTRLRGIYAARDFAPGENVCSFHGKFITREALFERGPSDPSFFDFVNEYAVADRKGERHLYPEPEKLDVPGGHLINQSCRPNVAWGDWHGDVLLVRAIRPIARGEELTVFYAWLGIRAAITGERHKCACAAPFCTGSIELRVEMVHQDETHAGPYLPPEEAETRFLADILNDTDVHEALLIRYARESGNQWSPSAKLSSGIDPGAFIGKLQMAATMAVRAARSLQGAGRIVSERRIAELAQRYKITATMAPPELSPLAPGEKRVLDCFGCGRIVTADDATRTLVHEPPECDAFRDMLERNSSVRGPYVERPQIVSPEVEDAQVAHLLKNVDGSFLVQAARGFGFATDDPEAACRAVVREMRARGWSLDLDKARAAAAAERAAGGAS